MRPGKMLKILAISLLIASVPFVSLLLSFGDDSGLTTLFLFAGLFMLSISLLMVSLIVIIKQQKSNVSQGNTQNFTEGFLALFVSGMLFYAGHKAGDQKYWGLLYLLSLYVLILGIMKLYIGATTKISYLHRISESTQRHIAFGALLIILILGLL
jgi:hypothetical protein